MTFKILDQYDLINGVTDSSIGSINPFAQVDSEQKTVRFLKNLGFKNVTEKDLIFADQVHGDGIHLCQKGDSGSIRLSVDALITNHKGQILVVKTADCLPILIFDPQKQVVAAIHAGRKSLTLNIIQNTIAKMVKNYGIKPKNLKIAISPHIRTCHYYLKSNRVKELSKTKWKKYFLKKDKIYFDMTKAAFDELLESGVLRKNIEDCQICTFCQSKKYYSARKKEENPAIYQQKFPCFANIIGIPK